MLFTFWGKLWKLGGAEDEVEANKTSFRRGSFRGENYNQLDISGWDLFWGEWNILVHLNNPIPGETRGHLIIGNKC